MSDEERRIILTALETIETSLNLLETKAEIAEGLLAKTHPDLIVEYQRNVQTVLQGRLSASAQVLQQIRKKILKSIP